MVRCEGDWKAGGSKSEMSGPNELFSGCFSQERLKLDGLGNHTSKIGFGPGGESVKNLDVPPLWNSKASDNTGTNKIEIPPGYRELKKGESPALGDIVKIPGREDIVYMSVDQDVMRDWSVRLKVRTLERNPDTLQFQTRTTPLDKFQRQHPDAVFFRKGAE